MRSGDATSSCRVQFPTWAWGSEKSTLCRGASEWAGVSYIVHGWRTNRSSSLSLGAQNSVKKGYQGEVEGGRWDEGQLRRVETYSALMAFLAPVADLIFALVVALRSVLI